MPEDLIPTCQLPEVVEYHRFQPSGPNCGVPPQLADAALNAVLRERDRWKYAATRAADHDPVMGAHIAANLKAYDTKHGSLGKRNEQGGEADSE